MNYYYSTSDELFHHGVLGMKWGRRKYQNPDGSLTTKGQQKVSKAYKKSMTKVTNSLNNNYQNRYMKSYNKAVNEMNDGLTDKYNKDYDKKLGSKAKDHDYLNDDKYNDGYEKLWQKTFDKHYNADTYKELTTNPNYKKAQDIAKQYSMEKFDDLVKDNKSYINDLKSKLD